MQTESIKDIDQAINDLRVNGIAIIRSYLLNTPELEEIKNKIHQLVCFIAKQYNLNIPDQSQNAINKTIIRLNGLNNKIGAFLNDTLNASPELFRLLISKKIEDLAKTILGIKNDSLISNNYRARVQIPGRDEISNLPWHQDSHYNNFYNKNNSIVIWTSISDIDNETGPIIFKKGSQIIKQVPRIEFIRQNKQKIYTIADEHIHDSRFKECSIPTKSGDVILIDMDLIHRSGTNKSKNKVKFSTQARFHNASAEGFLAEYL